MSEQETPKLDQEIVPLFEALRRAAFDGFWSKDAYTLMSVASTECPMDIIHVDNECKIYRYNGFIIIISEGVTPNVPHSDHLYILKGGQYMHNEGIKLVGILWQDSNENPKATPSDPMNLKHHGKGERTIKIQDPLIEDTNGHI